MWNKVTRRGNRWNTSETEVRRSLPPAPFPTAGLARDQLRTRPRRVLPPRVQPSRRPPTATSVTVRTPLCYRLRRCDEHAPPRASAPTALPSCRTPPCSTPSGAPATLPWTACSGLPAVCTSNLSECPARPTRACAGAVGAAAAADPPVAVVPWGYRLGVCPAHGVTLPKTKNPTAASWRCPGVCYGLAGVNLLPFTGVASSTYSWGSCWFSAVVHSTLCGGGCAVRTCRAALRCAWSSSACGAVVVLLPRRVPQTSVWTSTTWFRETRNVLGRLHVWLLKLHRWITTTSRQRPSNFRLGGVPSVSPSCHLVPPTHPQA